LIERSEDRAVEFVEYRGFGIGKTAIIFKRLEDGAGERGVESFEKLEINDADSIALGSQAITARFVGVVELGPWHAVLKDRIAGIPACIGLW
jgi:hypothetical protein